MMYTEFKAGQKEYKLRLNTRNLIALESKLGCNPLAIFGGNGEKIPTVQTMVEILHSALQVYHHSITMDDAYTIFDEWLEEHTLTDFIQVILQIYKDSGLIPKEEDTEKN